MKAMRLTSPAEVGSNPLQLVDIPRPLPSADEVILRVRACGVCHTDLHIVEGELPQKKTPVTPGHQIVGIVEQLGANVSRHRIGDRVGVAWLFSTCGTCEYCNRGEENLCLTAKFTGYDVDGGYGEYITAPASFAYPLPPTFTDEEAAPLLCAGIIGFRALRLCYIKPGDRLGLYGFGASAHITLQVARHWGCKVYVFSRRDHHRKFAEELGAVWTGAFDQLPPQPLHSAISFTPSGELVPHALRALRKGGTLALAGIYMTPIPALDYSLLYHERILRSVANSTRKDAIDFLRVAAEIPIKTEVEVFRLEESNRALQLLKQSKLRGAGVLKI